MSSAIIVSKKLTELGIFHKLESDVILTKRSAIKIPRINIDVAYLLGVITGDGTLTSSMRKKGGFHYTVKITAGSASYLKYLNKLFMTYFGVSGRIVKDKRKRSTFDLILKNAAIFWYFNSLGLPVGKKSQLHIPEVANKGDLLLNYIAGLVDTDGHIKPNRIQLKQKDKNFLEELCTTLNRLEMRCAEPRVNYTNGEPFYYIRFDNKVPSRATNK